MYVCAARKKLKPSPPTMTHVGTGSLGLSQEGAGEHLAKVSRAAGAQPWLRRRKLADGVSVTPESRPGRVSLKLAIRQGTQQHCIAGRGRAHRPGQRRAGNTSNCISEGPELPARLLLHRCSPTSGPPLCVAFRPGTGGDFLGPATALSPWSPGGTCLASPSQHAWHLLSGEANVEPLVQVCCVTVLLTAEVVPPGLTQACTGKGHPRWSPTRCLSLPSLGTAAEFLSTSSLGNCSYSLDPARWLVLSD